ncbi:amidohydrolase [Aliiroseovarius subalbicans]|uniref:amidohydrolase n=1 Tax=Aliiroseovarius subalbicans TaxID=2925840 RepID=UPI001F59088A|nr:amidohydrolase [Aliiroseovarius subalbicans]MCI2398881.1 amidohydrolase [Aliiroseovarius subalbicans]
MPDIVILNGCVITFDGPDAEALAITGGTITAVGSTAEIRDMAGSARVIDAQGNTVLPGFIDSHVHLFGGAAELDFLNLHEVFGVKQLAAAVRPYAASRPDDQLLFACSIDYALMGDRAITRHDLDAAMPDRPFAAIAADHHTVYANTKALDLAGVLHGKEVAEGSEVVMGKDGLATGELLEVGAFEPVLALTPLGGRELLGMTTGADPVPAPDAQTRAIDTSVIANGYKHCAAQGITGLHNMDGNFYQLELLSEMEQDGTLLCRTEIPMHLKHTDPVERVDEAAEMRARYNSDMVWSRRVKMFMDGVLDSRTAFMLEPYPGTDSCGDPLFSDAQFKQACIRADAMGLQIAVHAIGDAAVRQTLDGYEAAQKANGVRDSRHRIEHIETIHPDDIPRIAGLGAVASMQPLHAPRGGFFLPAYEPGDILHAHQIATAFPWKTIRDTGAALIFSTDWPVVPVDVMPTIQGAVAGADLPDIWPDQRIGLRESLAAYTRDNAWVEFNEHRKGRLRAGMMADVVVLDADIESLPAEQLGTAKAAVTICAGRITFEA